MSSSTTYGSGDYKLRCLEREVLTTSFADLVGHKRRRTHHWHSPWRTVQHFYPLQVADTLRRVKECQRLSLDLLAMSASTSNSAPIPRSIHQRLREIDSILASCVPVRYTLPHRHFFFPLLSNLKFHLSVTVEVPSSARIHCYGNRTASKRTDKSDRTTTVLYVLPSATRHRFCAPSPKTSKLQCTKTLNLRFDFAWNCRLSPTFWLLCEATWTITSSRPSKILLVLCWLLHRTLFSPSSLIVSVEISRWRYNRSKPNRTPLRFVHICVHCTALFLLDTSKRLLGGSLSGTKKQDAGTQDIKSLVLVSNGHAH